MAKSTLYNLTLFGPEITLISFLVVLFLCDAFLPRTRRSYFPLAVTIIACGFAAWITWRLNVNPTLYFSHLVANDGIANFFRYIFFFSCAAGLYLSYGSKEIHQESRMEYSILLLCVTFGLSLMAISMNFLVLYIGLETASIVSFVLAGFNRNSLRSNEASLKYLVFGGMSSGLMIYGFSLLYGYAGSLQYAEVARFLNHHSQQLPFAVTLAHVFIYAGIAYKISAFPMHFWTPDVYEGAPTPVAAFFSVGPKAAGFAALMRLLLAVYGTRDSAGSWRLILGVEHLYVLGVLSAITMTIGNLSAIGQSSAKRMLAYSSIAHVGYLMMGLVALNKAGVTAVLFYIFVYCMMNFGAFWVVSVVSDLTGSDDIDSFRGIGWRLPVLGTCMAVFLFSLTGIPLFAGFAGKFLLFGAVLSVPGFLWLALIGVLNSVVSLYYYARIIRALWLERPDSKPAPTMVLSLYHAIPLVGLAVPTVVFGLFFAPIVRFAEQSIAYFLG